MFPGLSNLDPLQYIDEGGSAESCNLASCQDYCVEAASGFNFDLSVDYPGVSLRGFISRFFSTYSKDTSLVAQCLASNQSVPNSVVMATCGV